MLFTTSIRPPSAFETKMPPPSSPVKLL